MDQSAIKESYPKSPNLWLRGWIDLLDFNSNDIILLIKKILIYYPKHPLAINLITSKFATELVKGPSSRSSLLRKLYSQITSRYNSDLLTQQKLNTTCLRYKLWRKSKATRSLKLQQDKYDIYYREKEKIGYSSSAVLKRSIRESKHLEVLELDECSWAGTVLEELKYVNSLKSLMIKNFQDISLDMFKKSIFASIENLALCGEKSKFNNTTEIWRIILELPKLKKLNIDCSEKFDVNKIPFNVLKKRNISFDIRVSHNNDDFEFSFPNEIGLSSLNVLGINLARRYGRPKWDFFEKENVPTQERLQRSLFVDLHSYNEDGVELSHLFQTCNNISVLALSLAKYVSCQQEEQVFFESIRNLPRLKHIVVQIDDTSVTQSCFYNDFSRTGDLFRHLRYCASSLESVNLHIDAGGSLGKRHRNYILSFFEACSNTLKSVTFRFMSESSSSNGMDMGTFYNALAKLKQITSLKLDYEGYSVLAFVSEFPYLNELILDPCLKSLKELTILAPSLHFEFNIPTIESLTKLSIACVTLLQNSSIERALTDFSKTLKHLELSLMVLRKKMWYKLLDRLESLSALETLKLEIDRLDIAEKEARSDMKMRIKSHFSLKVGFFAQGEKIENLEIKTGSMSMGMFFGATLIVDNDGNILYE